MPRIVALGDLDEDEIIFAEAATGELADPALNLSPTFGALERRLTLAELISTWATAITPEKGAPLIANTPEAAVALADALARLMDDMITRQVPWDNLDKLVPDELDEYWQQSLKFLKFVHPAWRKILAEKNAMESAERRDRIDRGRGQAACRLGRAGNRCRFHRLDAGDRQVACDHRQAVERRRSAARPRQGA